MQPQARQNLGVASMFARQKFLAVGSSMFYDKEPEEEREEEREQERGEEG